MLLKIYGTSGGCRLQSAAQTNNVLSTKQYSLSFGFLMRVIGNVDWSNLKHFSLPMARST